MSNQTPVGVPQQHLVYVDGFDALSELALDMRSAWNHATDRVW